MGAYNTNDIHNIALVGHTGAGKTWLFESLLATAGAIRSRGSLERGTTVSDYDPQEKRLGHSLDAAFASLDYEGRHINLIDTPGYPDLAGRSLSVLPAVETVAVVVNAASGVELVTQRMMEFAADRQLCRLVIINKIDVREGNPRSTLAQIREQFGRECLPLNLPADGGKRVVDCFFRATEESTDFSSVTQAHTEIVDQVVEMDEALMARYLEQGGELEPDQLHDAFEAALRAGHLIPVCFVSAESGAGLRELLEIVVRLLPNPAEGNPPRFLKGEGDAAEEVEVQPDANRHVVAHVVKVIVDPFVGKLGVFRVHQGTVRQGSQLFVGNGRKPIRVAHLLKLMGKEHHEIPAAVPGDICATAKIEELHFDAVLHDSHDEDHFHLQSLDLPPSMLGLAIEPERRGDEQRLSDALHKLAAEDPCVRLEFNSAGNESVMYGLGELHLRVLLERMSERYGVRVKTHPPSVPYRETITRAADGHNRHKKQTGGAGQFAEVHLRVEPLERGAGFEFVDEVFGGAIPSQYIPAVEKGVRQILAEGALAGYPVCDIRVVVNDGKYHAVDSKEVAFIACGRKAFLDAFHKAGPVALEPIVNVDIVTPAAAMGDVTGDLVSKRGRITGNAALAGQRVSVKALVPLSELDGYQSRLKSLTAGQGMYTVQLSGYEAVPPRRQQELVQAFRPAPDQD
jgi:elongation factor G